MGNRQPPPSAEDFTFFHEHQVRWAELDPQGIVFNPNYLVYADTAVTEYLRAIGFPYPDGLAPFGTDLFVVHASLDFRASARFDDQLKIGVRLDQFGRTSMRFAIGVFRDDQPLVSIVLTYVNGEREGGKPVPVPVALVERVRAFERRPPTQK